jgi:hypothetical protein
VATSISGAPSTSTRSTKLSRRPPAVQSNYSADLL